MAEVTAPAVEHLRQVLLEELTAALPGAAEMRVSLLAARIAARIDADLAVQVRTPKAFGPGSGEWETK